MFTNLFTRRLACCVFFFSLPFVLSATELQCHRMASRDVPENTLLGLEEAARLGCDLIELDIAPTLDGHFVLAHDAAIDRHSSGTGIVSDMYFAEFSLYDAGAWMDPSFTGLRHPGFLDVLRRAKDLKVRLLLDLKNSDSYPAIVDILEAEGMTSHVRFVGGPSRPVDPRFPYNGRPTISWKPDVTRQQVEAWQEEGKIVVASFQADDQEMNLSLMRQAVAAGVSILNTDQPRLASEALGRSVEQRFLRLLADCAQAHGSRKGALLLEISEWRQFPVAAFLATHLGDPDPIVSRAAAIALSRHPLPVPAAALLKKLEAAQPHGPAHLAFLLGVQQYPSADAAAVLKQLRRSHDEHILTEVLLAESRLNLPAPVEDYARFLSHPNPQVQSAAALACARHQGESCLPHLESLAAGLRQELERGPRRGDPARSVRQRAYQKTIAAIALLQNPAASTALRKTATTSIRSYDTEQASWTAASQSRHRSGVAELVSSLAATDPRVRNRAQSALELSNDPQLIPALLAALNSDSAEQQLRAAQILAWKGADDALSTLDRLAASPSNPAHFRWAATKIREIHGIRKQLQ